MMITVACAGSRTPQGFDGHSMVWVTGIRWEHWLETRNAAYIQSNILREMAKSEALFIIVLLSNLEISLLINCVNGRYF